MKPVLITGAEGQLGLALTEAFRLRGPVVAWARRDVDITDGAAVGSSVARVKPAVILNCAAYNEVDGAEEHAEIALGVNAFGVRSLARAAARVDAWLIHFSTDFVFDGSINRPYHEDDPPSPRGTYAASKMVGEWFARDAGRWLVLRVESLFGVRHRSERGRVGSIDRILDALERREPVRVFHDRVVSPSYLVDVTSAVSALIDRDVPSGIYHVVNSGYCTWYELAQEVARHVGGAEHLVPIASSELALKAPRPLFAALSNAKLAAAAFAMPSWQDAIERYVGVGRSSP